MEITNTQLTKLCSRVSCKWVKFAHLIGLSENEITKQNIGVDNVMRTSYAKCHKMMVLWMRKSPNNIVTNLMVKEVLHQLNLDDIFSEVFESDDATQQETVRTFSDLKENDTHMQELADMLGSDDTSWKGIGCRVFEDNHKAREKISEFVKELPKAQAKRFLGKLIERLANNLTVKVMIDACKKVDRNDVEAFFQEKAIKQDRLISDIYRKDTHLFDELALKIAGSGDDGWRKIAGQFKFSSGECDGIVNSTPPVATSQARMMLNLIKAVECNLPLSNFASICEDNLRTDVHDKVLEINEDLNKTLAKVETQNLNDQLQNMSLNEDLPENQMRCFHWLRALRNLHPDMFVPHLKEYASSEETKEKLATFSDLEPLVEYSEEELKDVVRVIVDEWEDIDKKLFSEERITGP